MAYVNKLSTKLPIEENTFNLINRENVSVGQRP